MTSAVGGGTPKGDESTDKLREWESEKGEGRVQISENFADVICTCPQRRSPLFIQME